MENDKIGLGLITCDRPDFFEKAYKSITRNDLMLVVVDDGTTSIKQNIDTNYIKTKGREGVAKSKNKALRFLLDNDCEHIFLMEDDIEVADQSVFEKYIETVKSTGIKHFNYALHGHHNLNHLDQPTVRKSVNYPDDIIIDLYPNLLGAFSYYHRDVLNDIGLMDEAFYNAMEHVDHTYQAIKKGYHPPFRWFADIHESSKYLKDIVPDHQNSKIRSDENFQSVFKKGLDTFIQKNKFSVVQGYGPDEKSYSEQETLDELKNIWKNHHQK